MHSLTRISNLVVTALANDACRGCRPSSNKQLEAYVLLWAVAGPAPGTTQQSTSASASMSPGFAGLRVTLWSIRQQDAIRPIVIMALAADPALSELVARVQNARVRLVPQILASRISNPRCKAGVEKVLDRHRPVPLRQRSPGATKGNMTSDERYWLRRYLEGMQMFTKVNVFNLTEYARVLYVDTDTLVTRPLEYLWNLTFLPHEAVAAVPTLTKGRFKIDRRYNKSHYGRAKRCRDYKYPENRKYNAGVFLGRPIGALYDAWLAAMDDRAFEFNCANDQELFNILLAKRHARCIGRSFNCYDLPVVTEPRSASSAASMASYYCGDVAVHGETRWNPSAWINDSAPTGSAPHVLHFAMKTKPWLATQHSYYQKMWTRLNHSWS